MATNLVGATPTEQVSPSCSATRDRISRAISAGRPSSLRAPATSRNASSSERGSTSGVTSRRISITAREAAVTRAKSGGRKTADGQSARARIVGIALRTPYSRAS
ncbi:hypothetical protein GCM10027615_72970 [Plantactinospora veratri]